MDAAFEPAVGEKYLPAMLSHGVPEDVPGCCSSCSCCAAPRVQRGLVAAAAANMAACALAAQAATALDEAEPFDTVWPLACRLLRKWRYCAHSCGSSSMFGKSKRKAIPAPA
eukprot:6195586-Pleurochrysis_carterae.AAC.2